MTVSNYFTIGIGAGRWRYYFTLSDAQKQLIEQHGIRYGIFQAHRTTDGSAHAYQYAGLQPEDANLDEYDAAQIAFSFAYSPIGVDGKRSKQPGVMWLTAVPSRGFRKSVGHRAMFALSVYEYASGSFGTEKAGPTRFSFPARPSTEEAKVWEHPQAKSTWDWMPEDVTDHICDGKLKCPWCELTFDGQADGDLVLADAWRAHIRQNSPDCKKQCLLELGIEEAEALEYLLVCHCEEQFASNHKMEAHWSTVSGSGCLETENKLRLVVGEEPLDIQPNAKCSYCGEERNAAAENSHLAAIKNKACLLQHNADRVAADLPVFVPPRCRHCQQTVALPAHLTQHLRAPTNAACFAAENEWRAENGQELLSDGLLWCQEPLCGKAMSKTPGKQNRVLLDTGTRYSSPNGSYLTDHYKNCHPEAERPKAAELRKRPTK